MAETLPMLEKDPRPAYRISRALRVLAFSLVLALVLVSLLIVVFRFVWDRYVSSFFGGGAYNTEPLLVVPAIFLFAIVFARMLWDAAEPRVQKPRSR